MEQKNRNPDKEETGRTGTGLCSKTARELGSAS
jgi:hypothetical protein